MYELLQEAILPANIVYTGLLVFAMFYWLTVFVGLLDLGSIDFDFEVDADLDVDVDMDADVDASGHTGGWINALHFLNFGRIPFMVIFSFLSLSMWTIGIWLNRWWGWDSLAFMAITFLPNLAISLIITKVLTTPLLPIFKDYQSGAAPIEYLGQAASLRLPLESGKVAQAEVKNDGSTLLINVKAAPEQLLALEKGKQVVITGKTEDGKYYLVKELIEV